MTPQSTKILSSRTLETGSSPTHTIIWMHGLGADGNDFVPIVNELNLFPDVHIRFIFPHANMRPITINNGYVMRAWYDIYNVRLNYQEDENGIRESQNAIEKLVDHQILCGIKHENIILAGFSQGGAMALHVGLRQKKKLAGILALSCYLPLVNTLLKEVQPANSSIPILMVHGNRDSVVPVKLAVQSRDLLLNNKYKIEWHEYAMEHAVCAEEIADIRSWIMQIVK
ncbi:MAG: alpha/beta hydrolase [Nitrosomonas sp.]|nr:alpha/beta hydrolase [Nitrosomonas sp.]